MDATNIPLHILILKVLLQYKHFSIWSLGWFWPVGLRVICVHHTRWTDRQTTKSPQEWGNLRLRRSWVCTGLSFALISFIKHCRLLTVSRQSGPVREEEQLPGQDRTAHALSECLSQRGNWRVSTFQPLHLNNRQIGRKGLSALCFCHPGIHQQGAPIHTNNPGKCSMRTANMNIGA